VLGVDGDGRPMTTTVGDPRAGGIPERLEAAAEAWDLTRRQSDVLGVLARGRSNKEIAVELGCAENTVELHVSELLRRTGASSRSELIARFWSEL
jgi:DNA-binding NarL/FixJ family response regulator